MAERPIIFSAPMIRPLLDGHKTQTRRITKRQDDIHVDGRGGWIYPGLLPYALGDRLWVKEAWKSESVYDDLVPSQMGGEEPLIYSADNAVQRWGWKPDALSRWGRYRHARFMPRWASRLTLTVTDVRVQRLQDISRGDAMAEGCPFANMADGPSPRDWFQDLWSSLHGPDAWGANPWVCALTFAAHKSNIDQMEVRNA
jgi:hypothetical protein